MTATSTRLRALTRLLEDEGHLTPYGRRQYLLVLDQYDALNVPDYDDIPTTAIPYDEESN